MDLKLPLEVNFIGGKNEVHREKIACDFPTL